VNIRAMPAVLSLLVTLIVLFGGYFAHQWFNLEKAHGKSDSIDAPCDTGSVADKTG